MHRVMLRLANVMAMAGGLVLTFLIVLTCVSVLGRVLNGVLHGDFMQGLAPGFANWAIAIGVGPVNGDFELVEAGIAFSIFAFLPLCQITGGHATVDVFAARFPDWLGRGIGMVVEIVFALVLILIAWRLYEGMLSKMRYGETTFLLQFPIWWAYAASFAGAVVAAVVGVYMAGVRTAEAFGRKSIVADGPGADH